MVTSVVTVFNVSTNLLSKPVIQGHIGKSLGLFLDYLEILAMFAKASIIIMIHYCIVTVIHCIVKKKMHIPNKCCTFLTNKLNKHI